ncbi:DUF4956 domain-containing protein [Acidobacteriota bacterium]
MQTNWKELLTTPGGFSSQSMSQIGVLVFLAVMVISLLSSLYLAFLYTKFYSSRATGSQVHRTFPLLGISITAIFICIQFSLPLSLGLLGALSIVRFRTPIKEPEEIGFIMLVVASSIACATFNLIFLGILLAIALLALMILRLKGGILKGRLNDGMVIVSMPSNTYKVKSKELLELLERILPKGRVDSITENNEESVLSYSFIRLEKETMLELSSVLKTVANEVETSMYFNRSGEV